MIVMYGVAFISFILGVIGYRVFDNIKEYYRNKKEVESVNSVFDEIYLLLDKSEFVTRVNNMATIKLDYYDIGEISIIYIIDKDDIVVMRSGEVLFTSRLASDDIIDKMIDKINELHGLYIDDVVNFYGILYSKVDFEEKFKIKLEDAISSIQEPKSDIDKIVNKNDSLFNMDDILDKISKFGISKLNEDEKNFLDNYK